MIDFDELRRHRQLHALHSYRMGHDEAYAAEHKARARRDMERRKALEAKIQALLAIAPAVGDQVQIAVAGHSHDGAIGTVQAVRVDWACNGSVTATVDLKPKPRTTKLPPWAARQRRFEAQPHGVAQLSPVVVRLQCVPVEHLRPARLAFAEPGGAGD